MKLFDPTRDTGPVEVGEAGTTTLADLAARMRAIELAIADLKQSIDLLPAIARKLYMADVDLPPAYALRAERFGYLSQNEEDGLLLALFKRIGMGGRRFVELGCGMNGGNSGFFAQECGWAGVMVDADAASVQKVGLRFQVDAVTPVQTRVTREDVNGLLTQHGFTGEVDLLSIDIDGMDYWVWEAVTACTPRVVAIEYNWLFGPDRAVTIPYAPDFTLGTVATRAYRGASLAALVHLGRRKGYRLVATERVNAIFLRDDIAPEIPAIDVARAYRPPTNVSRAKKDVFGKIHRARLPLVTVTAAGDEAVSETTPGSRPLRFLFVIQYPGYMRYFDSVIGLLAQRGHHVDVIFDNPRKQVEGLEAVSGMGTHVEVRGRSPERDPLWKLVGASVRGTIDYVRYLHPQFVDTPYLRGRMRSALPPVLRFLGWWHTSSRATTRRLIGFLTACERAIPSSPDLERFIQSCQPDAVLVTPLVTDRCPQVDYVKSAQALGIPAALCVASWDHLTTKGLMRIQPDLVSVWNEEQKAEAIEYHGTDPARIVVTGAQPFDRWFERRPTAREAFCAKVGLDPAAPFILFVGSTKSISAPDAELPFVRRWVEALRREPALAKVGILVRPHPYNSDHWRDVEFPDLPNVAIYPRSANPVNEADRQDYFDSLHHSETVVGVNTTAMIEAAIAGRTVHSVLADDFKDTQEGTLHFRYLLAENGGFLFVARDLADHARQLVETLRDPAVGRAACARFVASFIRPLGLDRPATPVLVDALEQLAASERRAPVRPRSAWHPLRVALWLAGAVAYYRDPAHVRKAIWKARQRAAARRKDSRQRSE